MTLSDHWFFSRPNWQEVNDPDWAVVKQLILIDSGQDHTVFNRVSRCTGEAWSYTGRHCLKWGREDLWHMLPMKIGAYRATTSLLFMEILNISLQLQLVWDHSRLWRTCTNLCFCCTFTSKHHLHPLNFRKYLLFFPENSEQCHCMHYQMCVCVCVFRVQLPRQGRGVLLWPESGQSIPQLGHPWSEERGRSLRGLPWLHSWDQLWDVHTRVLQTCWGRDDPLACHICPLFMQTTCNPLLTCPGERWWRQPLHPMLVWLWRFCETVVCPGLRPGNTE